MSPAEAILSATQVRPRPRPAAALLAGLGLAAAALALAIVAAPPLGLALLALAALVLLLMAAVYTTRHRPALMVALVTIEVLSGTNLFPIDPQPRAVIRYVLLAVFCLPLLPELWRLRRHLLSGNFRNYLLYLSWAALTTAWSLNPAISAGRVFIVLTLFMALATVAWWVQNQADVDRVLHFFLVGCAAVLAVEAGSALFLPSDMVWLEDLGIERFRAVFDNPNMVGVVSLSMVSVGLAYWARAQRGTRLWVGAAMLVAVVMAALADSRAPWVALVVSGAPYLIWRYRWRGLLWSALGLGTAALALLVVSSHFSGYINRGGDTVSDLTGRSEVWAYAEQEVAKRPWFGYGYEVDGEIFLSNDFPSWDEVWNLGAHSSIHDLYLGHAVGVGIPAVLFWLTIYLWPLVSLFRRKEDPWGLKPIVLLGVAPVLIHATVESSAGDARNSAGLFMVLIWMLAERQRQIARQNAAQQAEQRREQDPAMALIAEL